jgi:hypothetical protein
MSEDKPKMQVFMSAEINEIATALAKAQGVMGGAEANASNPHKKNKYANLAAVMDALKKPLSENGLAITQLVESDENKTAVRTLLVHSSGQWFMARASLATEGYHGVNDAQAMGLVISYMRRYQASGITGLHQEDDDAASVKAAPAEKAEPKKAPEENARELAEAIKKITNIVHLNNWWAKHHAEVEALPELLSKKVQATWHKVKGEIEGAKKDVSNPEPELPNSDTDQQPPKEETKTEEV